MVQCTKLDCYLELFEKDVVEVRMNIDGDEIKIYRCPKCFTIVKERD